MVNRVGDLPLALVLAARDEPYELLTRIAVHDATRVIEPRPLSAAAVASLGGDFEATGGNPFYVHALLAAGGDGTPRPVVDSIALRLEALPACVPPLARALAVLDGMAGGTVAARARRARRAHDRRGLRGAARADIVRGEDFAHPLVRARRLRGDPGRRARRAARRGRAAAHARRSTSPRRSWPPGPGLGAWAVDALRAAARTAWARGAPDEAAALLRRAAEEEMPRAQLAGLLRELARALVASPGPDGLPVHARSARARRARGTRRDLARTRPRPVRPGVLRGRGPRSSRERGRRRARARDGRGARPLAGAKFGGLDAIARGSRLSRSGPGSKWHATRPRGRRRRRRGGARDGPPAEWGRRRRWWRCMAAGRYEQADAEWTGVAESARAAGALDTLRMAVALRAMVRLRMGRVADVEADLRGLIGWVAELELPLRAYRTALPSVVSPLVDALIERGQLEEAARWPALTGLEADLPEEFGFTFMLDSLARLRLAQGRSRMRCARPRGDRRQRAWGFAIPASSRPVHARAALHASGRTSEALDACDEQVDRARAFGVAREEGMALRAHRRDHRRRDSGPGGRRARTLRGAARVRPRADRPRRPRAAAPGARHRRAPRGDERSPRAPARTRQDRRQAAPRGATGVARAHRRAAARRPAGRRRPRQPRDRRGPVPHREDRRRPPRRRLPQARDRLARPASRAPRAGTTTTGTTEWRTIFSAREPRKTRATGPMGSSRPRARRRRPTPRPRSPRPRSRRGRRPHRSPRRRECRTPAA